MTVEVTNWNYTLINMLHVFIIDLYLLFCALEPRTTRVEISIIGDSEASRRLHLGDICTRVRLPNALASDVGD